MLATVNNFYLPSNTDSNYFPSTTKDKVAANMKAIRLVKELEENNESASPSEQETLSKYVGWGGLANEFFAEYNLKFKAEREELKTLVTTSEYEALKSSALTAYYTDPMIAREMWNKIVDYGFTGGNVLDPSAGTGIFFMTMPEELRTTTTLYATELDSITGAILTQLFPQAHVLVQGFEKTPFKPVFDLIITNVPFGDIRIIDKDYEKPYLIHDYFLKKSVDLLEENGLVTIITSIGTVDKDNSILPEIQSKADFLGGIRLPSNAFKRIAGTDVTSDILMFQRKEN
ncbi:SNF2 family protein [Ligilactobacillus equi]|uniref:SNF2 family protein n=1 Tax=Ligilactobacillus equi DPC 6820 TaxID=1392007 RepID=V7HX65_9LACO|nr:SNF2 family protein [Ligilactobacillus equi]ETA74477.1 SNF2 family protein [Ligilactobacillus equi DPC 6820]